MRYVEKFINYTDEDVAVVVGGTVPGDMVVDGGVFVIEAFDGTSPVVDVGFVADNQGGTADPNALSTALDVEAVGQDKFDELAATTNKQCTVADQITATFSVSSGTPSQGKAVVWAVVANDNLLNQ